VQNADILDQLTQLTESKCPATSHLIAALLLKLKLLVDISSIKLARKVFAHTGLIEDWHHSVKFAVTHSNLSPPFTKLSSGELISMEIRIRKQALKIGMKIMDVNNKFMFTMMI
jgi:hypothetical protein